MRLTVLAQDESSRGKGMHRPTLLLRYIQSLKSSSTINLSSASNKSSRSFSEAASAALHNSSSRGSGGQQSEDGSMALQGTGVGGTAASPGLRVGNLPVVSEYVVKVFNATLCGW